MLFPISGVEVNPFVPFLVALFVSFFTSMGGVSGAFLLLPFQVSVLGYTSPSVSATNQVFNIVAIPSGVYRYIKEGRMLWPLSKYIIIGTLPGVFIGAWVRVEFLPNPRNFKLFVSFILIYIGYKLFVDILKNKSTTSKPTPNKETVSTVTILESSFKEVRFEYDKNECAFKPLHILTLCFVVGIIGGIYGIGGGSIIAPFLVTFFALPVYTIAGAALSGTFATSIAGVLFYHLLASFYPTQSVSPDWLLGCLFGIGGFIGMYFGAKTQHLIPSKVIKGILCFSTLFIAGKYVLDFIQ
ncbi:sulfite exporter TauE/SafE family protein [bacterium]|nr:sulfite exporter TauE/SafE family protein [bacterium]